MTMVPVDIDGLVAMATSMRKRIDRAIEALRDPGLDVEERVNAALDILEE